MDTALIQRISYSKSFISAWENRDPVTAAIIIKDHRSYLDTELPKLKKFKTYKSLLRNVCNYWEKPQHDEQEFKKPQFNQTYPKDRWAKEYLSIINAILREYFLASKAWLVNPRIDTFEPITHTAEKVLEGQIEKLKADSYYINPTSLSTTSDPSFSEKIYSPIKNKGFDSNFLDALLMQVPLLPEEKRERLAEKEVVEGFVLLKNIFQGMEDDLGKGQLTGDLDWRKMIADLIRENQGMWVQDRKGSKSVYILAKENNLEFRKLLYILRQIRFPMSKSKHGRIGNYVLEHNLPLFDKILPRLQLIWKHEKNFKGWIQYFKEEQKWSKSRISKFMKSRIKRGNITPNFFEILEPPPSRKLFTHLTNDKGGIRELFEALPAEWDVFGKQHTIKNRLLELRRVCIKANETLLTAGMES